MADFRSSGEVIYSFYVRRDGIEIGLQTSIVSLDGQIDFKSYFRRLKAQRLPLAEQSSFIPVTDYLQNH